MLKLETSIQYLTGVGPKMAEKLKRLGINNVRDLLFYYPWRYDDFSHPVLIRNLRIGCEAIIKAEIKSVKKTYTKRRWMTLIETILEDDSGEIKAVWFNQPFLMTILKPGQEWLFAGKVNFDFSSKKKTLSVTQYEKEPITLPVYSETEGLNSKYLRKIIKPLIFQVDSLIKEFLPPNIIKNQNLIDIKNALKNIHFPTAASELEKAKKRLAFDELFLISLRMLTAKQELSKSSAIALLFNKDILQDFVRNLPFQLTNAQRKVAWEIIKDLGRNVPMNRLLEGDVGSGKTVVAAMAVLVVACRNYQSVWLAPTEILANQHFQNVAKLLKPFKIKTGLLTSANRKANLEQDNLIIGTHALLQKNIQIPKLALIIVDEQHRFGVKQRAHLRQGYGGQAHLKIPHFLSMTATPIPRSLALALYGDLDMSVIDEMPPGRQKVITRIVAPQNRLKAYDFIKNEVMSGRQVFVICPLIEPSDSLKVNLFDMDRKSAIEEHKKLSQKIFPDLKIGLLHGKMKSKEKEETMKKFAQGKIDILVSTAVVEVGIDIPNATVMMIESAERFGLAQLHQFRGRVGRGKRQSYCFLFSESPARSASQSDAGGWSENNKKRLGAMIHCHNGFELAEKDLQIRGPGELVGLRQSGIPDLKMASLGDTILIKEARQAAQEIIENDLESYPLLQEKLAEFETERHLE